MKHAATEWEPPAPFSWRPTYRLAQTLPSIVTDYREDPVREVVSHVDKKWANLICSDLFTSEGERHMPILDIDIPAELIPSTTEGHSHLYIGKALTWRQYRKLLKALYKAGIIEYGFYSAAKRRGYTSVRTPWTKKEV